MSRVGNPAEIQNAVDEIYDIKKNTITLDKCTGFVTYILSTLYFAKKEKQDRDEWDYPDIGRGVASTFARINIDHKVISDRVNEVGDGMDKALDYFNAGDMTLRDDMIKVIESKHSAYFVEHLYYDIAAVQLFFTVKNPKLVLHVEGSNVLK